MGTTEQFEVRDSWVRVDSMVDTYAEIAEEAFGHFLLEKDNPIPHPGPERDFTAHYEHEDRKVVWGIKTIVFSAMAIEAAAFEFAGIQLGDKVAEQYLDKMDVVGKWMIVPRLVCARSLREDGPAMNGLRGLVTARNALVHHKSREWDQAGKAMQSMKKRWTTFENVQVPNAFKTLILLSLELDAVLGTTTGPLPFFGKEVFTATPRNPLVEQVVQRCREVHRTNWRET
ncbi:hypothetical protein [Pseudomonas sp. C32]|jgi:hypothetical protein|uniref:hypothetical protein n=1 Tax=Pseudomonas sp. C32 TaxID=1529208 RepID=UPI002608045A|nr:hypothetical protein [Pseudomonas sp. C32]MDN4547168.1 hypothetical protein [Pseudomonas sp. C32]